MVDNIGIAKALSDPMRYQFLKMLAQKKTSCCPVPGEDACRPGICNCELMAEFNLIQSRVSYHMKELTECGLVSEEPRGKWKFYFINTKTLENFIQQLKQDFAVE